jgi:hypothetical protein
LDTFDLERAITILADPGRLFPESSAGAIFAGEHAGGRGLDAGARAA